MNFQVSNICRTGLRLEKNDTRLGLQIETIERGLVPKVLHSDYAKKTPTFCRCLKGLFYKKKLYFYSAEK